MATYTVSELQDITTESQINNWSDAKILRFQTMSEAILLSLDLDSSISGYSDAYKSSVIYIFDFLVANPASLAKQSQGRVSKEFLNELPQIVGTMLQKFITGDDSSIMTTYFERRDIGRR